MAPADSTALGPRDHRATWVASSWLRLPPWQPAVGVAARRPSRGPVQTAPPGPRSQAAAGLHGTWRFPRTRAVFRGPRRRAGVGGAPAWSWVLLHVVAVSVGAGGGGAWVSAQLPLSSASPQGHHGSWLVIHSSSFCGLKSTLILILEKLFSSCLNLNFR